MRAVLTQIRSAVVRRRAQTATVLLVSLLAGAVSTMAVTLLVRSTQPWDDAFERSAGAHLIFHFDASRVTPAQLHATQSLPGVTAAGPPYTTVVVPFARAEQKGRLLLIGRADPGGAIDRMTLRAGRWPRAPGEIAVTGTQDSSIPFRPRVGETIRALTSRGTVDFKVVGEVIDLGGHGTEADFTNGIAAAWVLPAELGQFLDGGEFPVGYEMAYRFQTAATADELYADRRLIEAALPAGAESAPVGDWLSMRQGSIWLIVLFSTIIVSFTAFALLALAVIVSSVVAGSVLASYREIGVIKALGFTPAQVVAVFTGQMLVPGLSGALLGVPFGVAASRPLLDLSTDAMQLPHAAIFDPAVAVAVPAAIAILACGAALIPSLRAAATDSVRAMTLGTSPPSTRTSRLATLLRRLRAPRPLSLGAGDAFARPVRGLLTLTTLAIGIATATFAIGFQDTFVRVLVNSKASYGYGQDVVVSRYPGLADDAVMAQLTHQPETRHIVAMKSLPARVPGQKDPPVLYAMRGDALALGYRAERGRWFEAPGEATISAGLARSTHLKVGDLFTASLVGGPPLTLEVVGLYNDFNAPAGSVRVGWDTLATAEPGVGPDQYLVKLAPGTDARAYARRIAAVAPNSLDAQTTVIDDISFTTNGITAMVAVLALILLAISGAGVFNATLLTTRERVRDISVLKALGMSSPQIALMAAGATLVLAALGAVIGVPLGIWLQGLVWDGILGLFGVVSTQAFSLAVVPIGLALIAAIALALLGAALPARWAAAIPVAQVLRAE